MKPIRLISGFLTVGVWTLLSRILGFVREIMILSLIGPGPVMDAFVAAFRLPNMFRRFFAEGAFNAAFVPMFSSKLEGDEDAAKFGRDALNGLALCTLMLTAVAMIFMPGLVWATAGGFGEERFELAVGFGRIVFPYIFFMSLSALFSGVLNATGRFAAAAAAPVLLNVMVIGAMTMAWAMGGPAIDWLVWTIPLAGVAQLALTWGAAAQAGFALHLGRPRWTPDMGLMCAPRYLPRWPRVSCRSTLLSASLLLRPTTMRSAGFSLQTGCISCRLGSSASLSASCSCRTFRANSKRTTPKGRAPLTLGPPSFPWRSPCPVPLPSW